MKTILYLEVDLRFAQSFITYIFRPVWRIFSLGGEMEETGGDQGRSGGSHQQT